MFARTPKAMAVLSLASLIFALPKPGYTKRISSFAFLRVFLENLAARPVNILYVAD